MSAPMKPWEGGKMAMDPRNAYASQRIPSQSYQQQQLYSSSPAAPVSRPQVTLRNGHSLHAPANAAPPALPRRSYQGVMNSSSYGGYASGYGNGMGMYSGMPYGGYGSQGYGTTAYGGYTGYGNYGGGYQMNRYGCMPGGGLVEDRFIQIAEESSRPAFQSIESVVRAVSSISFMLESTFGAVYSSFRAMLGVAENIGRLRSSFGQFFSTFAVLRFLQWLYRKLMYLLGLQHGSSEDVWRAASSADESMKARSSWFMMAFMGVILSGPYLVYKMLQSLNLTSLDPNDPRCWKRSAVPLQTVLAMYPFVGESQQELSFRAGQLLRLAPQEFQPRVRGWLLATADDEKSGLIPSNYVRQVVLQPKQPHSRSSGHPEQPAEAFAPNQWASFPTNVAFAGPNAAVDTAGVPDRVTLPDIAEMPESAPSAALQNPQEPRNPATECPPPSTSQQVDNPVSLQSPSSMPHPPTQNLGDTPAEGISPHGSKTPQE